MLDMDHAGDRVQVATFASPVTDDDLDRFRRERERALDSGSPHVLVVVGTGVRRVPSAKIHHLVPWHRRLQEEIAELTPAMAFVMRSPVIVNIVRTIVSMLPLRSTVQFFDDADEALSWAAEQAQALDIPRVGSR